MRTTASTGIAGSVVRRVASLLAAASLTAAGLVVPVVATATPAQAAVRSVPADFDAQVLSLTNSERTRRGLAPLRHATCVDSFAARHTVNMAKKNRMYHQGLRPILRTCKMRGVGENVAWRSGGMTAQQVVSMWMNSPGHRANILNKRYRYLGVDAHQSSRGRIFAGQVFGR